MVRSITAILRSLSSIIRLLSFILDRGERDIPDTLDRADGVPGGMVRVPAVDMAFPVISGLVLPREAVSDGGSGVIVQFNPLRDE